MEELINKLDTTDQFSILQNSYKQIEYAWSNKIELIKDNFNDIDKIIICGMGGSAIGGDLLTNLIQDELSIPIFVNRNYTLPTFCNKNSLVIISSYSGNTEESISAFYQAVNKRCKIITMSTGGKIKELSIAHKFSFISLQEGFQPRYALYMLLFTLLKIFQLLQLIKNKDEFVNECINLLKEKSAIYNKDNSEPEKFALSLLGFIPIIYAATDFNNSIGFRFKGQLNENSKLHAFCNLIPEMNHNEIIGWETISENLMRTKVVYLIDDQMHQRIKLRFEILEQLLNQQNIEVLKISSSESSVNLRLIDSLYFSDWVSYVLAIYRKKDPVEIDNINILKEKLSKI
ncbi:MAG: bifunctional phosphoglucose/phosphomannose isomerase [bacterium]